MKMVNSLAMLGALALGTVSYADIQVWTRDRNNPDPLVGPSQVSATVIPVPNDPTTFDVTFTTESLFTAVPAGSIEWIVWVFDPASANGDPVSSIRSLTIDTTTGFRQGNIRLIIAPAPLPGSTQSQPDFPISWDRLLFFTGVLDLGSITTIPADFAPSVSACIAVAGNVGTATALNPRDKAEVGQIYRSQAQGRTVNNQFLGGNIFADIVAAGPDSLAIVSSQIPNSTDVDRKAIGYIVAGKSIQGNIVSEGSPFGGPNNAVRSGSIEAVVVSSATESDPGITGNILAQRGTINSILTTGMIGTDAAAKSQIRAGRGITQIRAIAESSSTVLGVDFVADVTANLLGGDVDTFFRQDKSLNKLETAGNFIGTINADFIRPPTDTSTELDWGIFVGGTFTGDIHVRASVLGASIAIGSFTAPTTAMPNTGHIVIDHSLDGAVVATAANGKIPYISIGRTPTANFYRPGMLGSDSEPQTVPFRPWQPAPFNQPQVDSMIAAPEIGTITISNMFQAGDKRYAPRIESPKIGTLIIDDFRQGLVWSGHLEYVLDANGNPTIDAATGRPNLLTPQDDTNITQKSPKSNSAV